MNLARRLSRPDTKRVFVGRRHLLESDVQRAEVLLREINAEMGESGFAANVGVFRRLRWAARDAAEAVRILETHRRAGRLTPEGLETLERYRKFYEAAELILIGQYPYPGDPVATAPRADFWDENEVD